MDPALISHPNLGSSFFQRWCLSRPSCDSAPPVIRKECFLLNLRGQKIAHIFRGLKSSHNCWIGQMKTRVFGLCSPVRPKSFEDYGTQKSFLCACTCLWTLQLDLMILPSTPCFFWVFFHICKEVSRQFSPLNYMQQSSSFKPMKHHSGSPYMDFTEADHPKRLTSTQGEERRNASNH